MGSSYFIDHQLDPRDADLSMIFKTVGHDLPLSWMPYAGLLARDLGIPALKDIVFVTGAESNADLATLLDRVPLPERLKLIATLNRYIRNVSPQDAFSRNRVPFLFFSCGRWEHHQEPRDDLDLLNYAKMARLAHYSFDLTCQFDTEPSVPGHREPEETVAFEASTFKKSLGELYPLLCEWAGVNDMDDREALDRMAAQILAAQI
ncbi:hypothetical protein [Luteolibacter soli]|uniref:Uncharacterized protein n=1 Tax=Luteolibacter soli TaxID=3135280 RepID=A0ABU9ARW6_9BACT